MSAAACPHLVPPQVFTFHFVARSVSQTESEEEEPVAAEAAVDFTSQNSAASVSSSEPTGTDSRCEDDHLMHADGVPQGTCSLTALFFYLLQLLSV